jgi:protein-L-isoaspartate(D-aspartate) O-methyltransferase
MVDMNIEQARHNMIEQQIRTWEVLDQRVLDLILRTPREDYVPRRYRNLAFNDMEIPLGHGEVMMAPKLEGRMLQALDVKPHEKVLEVGTGSGYVTALLAGAGEHVVSVDIYPEFTNDAGRALAEHGVDNVTLETGDAVDGWDKHAPYDVIAITGSLPVLGTGFDAFKRSLKVGGRLFVIVGEAPVMEALLITRTGENQWQQEALLETVVPPLINAPRPRRFEL